MAVRAVVFDIGGVLEKVGAPVWAQRWRALLGMDSDQFQAALAQVDPDGRIEIGTMSEDEYRHRYAQVLGLTEEQEADFLADMWDWYCGEPDKQLIDYAASLRPRFRTGILSNSADGARREEARRYGLPDLVDEIVYSHEVGLAKPDPRVYALTCERLGVHPSEAVFVDDVPVCVEAANACGLLGILHETAEATIARIGSLLPV